jgi:hypothetical protein
MERPMEGEPIESGWKPGNMESLWKVDAIVWKVDGSATWKAYGKWMESLWKVDGKAYGKWMERPMESGWKGLWKVDGKAYGKWMES